MTLTGTFTKAYAMQKRARLRSALGLIVALVVYLTQAHAQDIRLTGAQLSTEMRDTLLERLTITQEQPEDPDVDYMIALAQGSYSAVLAGLYQMGYFGADVSIKIDGREASEISPFATPDKIDEIIINVIPGPQFQFAKVDIGPAPKGFVFPKALSVGQPASTELIEAATQQVASAWEDKGFAKIRIAEQSIIANHADKTLNVRVRFELGPKLSYGALSITGGEQVRRERIAAIAGLPNGQTITPELTRLVENRLRDSGAFKIVDLQEADQPSADNRLDYNLTLQNAPKRRRGLGLEYDSDHGLIFSTYFLHRNLFGGAERFRVGLEMRGIGRDPDTRDYKLEYNFTRPATFHANIDFYTSMRFEKEQEPRYNSQQIVSEMGLRYRESEELVYSVGVGYRRSEVEDEFGNRDFEILTLPITQAFDNRDNKLDARKGRFTRTTLMPFRGIKNTGSGYHFDIDFRAYHTFREDRRFTWAGRARLGFLSGVKPKNAPADFLFFSGGGGTVRGQKYQSLALTLSDGRKVGGSSFASLSAEFRARLWESFGLVGFADLGFLGENNFENTQDHAGTGFGLRYETLFGPLRLDVATPTNNDDAFKRVEVYLGIGQAF